MALKVAAALLCITFLPLEAKASPENANENTTLIIPPEILVDSANPFDEATKAFAWLGLKWCGPGTDSENYDDLGYWTKTDACCRDHDHCEHYIKAGDTKYGLHNPTDYTRSHCDCDFEFKHCLLKANEAVSDTVGGIFFNSVEMVCFKKDYPIKKCKEYRGDYCLKYTVDKGQPKEWQFFAPAEYRRCQKGKKGKKCRKHYYKQ